MSASLTTFIEFEGTQEELKAMVMVIKEYSSHNRDIALEFPRINPKKKFDGKNDVLLEQMSDEKLDEFLAKCKKKVYIEAGGPYGVYGRVYEAGLFEAISEVAPKAKFKANTSGYTTGQRENFIGELKNGELYFTYSHMMEEYDCDNEDEVAEEWFTEAKIYNPITNEYKKKYSEEDYIRAMMNKMPLNEFKNVFGLSEENVSNNDYYDYIYECYCAYSFPEIDFIDFKYTFPEAKIEEEEFNQNVLMAIEKYGLVGFDVFSE